MLDESACGNGRRSSITAAILLALAASAAAACAPAGPEKASLALGEDGDDDKDDKASGGSIDGTPDKGPGKTVVTATPGAYAHSKDTLFALDTTAKKATEIGKFKCVPPDDSVLDIAVNGDGGLYATTFTRFLKINATTGDCSVLGELAAASGFAAYPNSLSFVPAGVLDPAKEVLVGYALDPTTKRRDAYVQLDPSNGSLKRVGQLNPPFGSTRYESSGDLVVLANDANRTYLTVQSSNGGTDYLAEVDPQTGTIRQVIGDTKQSNLFGLAYWAGTAYAFSDSGNAFAIDIKTAAATAIAFEGASGAIWFGAGVTTKAPK